MDGTALFGRWYLTCSAGLCNGGSKDFRGGPDFRNLEETAFKSDGEFRERIINKQQLNNYIKCLQHFSKSATLMSLYKNKLHDGGLCIVLLLLLPFMG